MSLRDIKTEALIKELIDRCGDQLHDPEPQFDGVLSFLTRKEIEDFMDNLHEVLMLRKEKANLADRR